MDPMAASVWGEMVAGAVLWCGDAIAVESELIGVYMKDSTTLVLTREKHRRGVRRTANSPRVLVATTVGQRCYGARRGERRCTIGIQR
jgi:hypothetical protein